MLACYATSQSIVEQLSTILHSINHACKILDLLSLSNGLHNCRVDRLSTGLWNRVVKRTNCQLGSGIRLLRWTNCQWVWIKIVNLTCQMEFVVVIQDVGYDSALSLIIDIRTVIPGSGTTAPVGWAALPLFQTGPGRYMASGYYHLPIFKVCYFASVVLYPLASGCNAFPVLCMPVVHQAVLRALCNAFSVQCMSLVHQAGLRAQCTPQMPARSCIVVSM